MTQAVVEVSTSDGSKVLERLVAAQGSGRSPATVCRQERVLAHLLLFLDHVDVAGTLGDSVAAALAAERDVGREGAFFRVLGIQDLVTCLPLFLAPGWLAVRTAERRTQISVVDRLAGQLVKAGRAQTSAVVREAAREARQLST